MIDVPPLLVGGVKVTVALASPAVAVPIVGAPGIVALIVIDIPMLDLPAFESVTVNEPTNVPVIVGVPVTRQLLASKIKPGGTPDILHVYGGTPPVAVQV